MRKLW